MPVFSYLAIPQKGDKKELCSTLSSMEYCQVIPADNQDVVILVTDTPDVDTEKALQLQLHELPTLQSLSLAFGYDENE